MIPFSSFHLCFLLLLQCLEWWNHGITFSHGPHLLCHRVHMTQHDVRCNVLLMRHVRN